MGTHPRQSSDDVSSAGGDGELPEGVVSDLRADARCRAIGAVLTARDEPMPLLDLARAVLARESDSEGEAIDDAAVAELRGEIYERHLPKLTAAGVVSFDSLVSTVALTEEGERLLGADR